MRKITFFSLLPGQSRPWFRRPGGGQGPAPTGFKDCADCPDMVPITPGSFTMGAAWRKRPARAYPSHRGHAVPLHKVTFAKGFAMGKSR